MLMLDLIIILMYHRWLPKS